MLVAGILVPALAAKLGAAPAATWSPSAPACGRARSMASRAWPTCGRSERKAGSGEAIARETDDLIVRQRRMSSITGLSSALSMMAAGGAVWVALFLTTGQTGEDRLDGPTVALVVFLVMAVFEATAPLPLAYQFLGRTKAAARRLTEIADMRPRIRDPGTPRSSSPIRHDLEVRRCYLRLRQDGARQRPASPSGRPHRHPAGAKRLRKIDPRPTGPPADRPRRRPGNPGRRRSSRTSVRRTCTAASPMSARTPTCSPPTSATTC